MMIKKSYNCSGSTVTAVGATLGASVSSPGMTNLANEVFRFVSGSSG